jgi:uncharacterized membrane protein
MAAFFSSLPRTVIAGFILAAIVYVLLTNGVISSGFWPYLFRWLHIISGVMWIGLLWYFNFVQTPSMAVIPAEQKPAVTKQIAPRALFWFRWGAMATLFTGLILAWLNGYLMDAVTLQPSARPIGIGFYLAFIMWFNVWFIIWPNQKKILGITPVDAEATAKAAKLAGAASRFNTMFSIPMLLCMAAQSHLG